MSSRGPEKGGEFERLICRMFTKWLTGNERPEVLWRSATSGAKATQDAKAGRQSKMGGDLVAIASEGQPLVDVFSIECKDRKSYGKIEGFFKEQGEVWQWWGQCVHDAEVSNREPLMVFKGNRTPIYIMYCIDFFDGYPLFTDHPPNRLIKQEGGLRDIGIVLFEDWLGFYKPKLLLEYLKRFRDGD